MSWCLGVSHLGLTFLFTCLACCWEHGLRVEPVTDLPWALVRPGKPWPALLGGGRLSRSCCCYWFVVTEGLPLHALSVPSVVSLATPSIPTLHQAFSSLLKKKNWVREYQELHLCLSSSSLSRHRAQKWIHAEALWVIPVAHVIMQYCGRVQLFSMTFS